MEQINKIITLWYPIFFLISAVVALAVWCLASKRKARLDIEQVSIPIIA